MISGQVRDSDKCSEFCIIDGETFKKKIMREEQMMEDRLWNYIDGNANTDEQQAIENLLAAQSEWKRKYQQLMEINQLLYATAIHSGINQISCEQLHTDEGVIFYSAQMRSGNTTNGKVVLLK